MKRIAILGSTGSIGTQTLDVMRAAPGRFAVHALAAGSRWREAFAQAREFEARAVVLADRRLESEVDRNQLPAGCKLLWGDEGVAEIVAAPEVDIVVAAMVGAAGLFGTIAALEAGKDVALANKESLVVGGPLVTKLAAAKGKKLLPVDSEHSAIFQCLQAGRRNEVARIVLTASGGPFRTRPIDSFESITVAEALKHPTWQMGPKITIDSATMMNKALEIIEARWLFDLKADEIAVTIHPQSIVHSFVEFIDGSAIAQASPPDMRLPIQYALAFPERISGPARKMDWQRPGAWEFFAPEPARYPALGLGMKVAERGGTAGAALNAANEVAVARFLAGSLRFTEIAPLCEEILERHEYEPAPSLKALQETDRRARQEADIWIRCRSSSSS